MHGGGGCEKNIKEALKLIQYDESNRPCVVLCDIYLGAEDLGLELYEKVQQKYSDIPFVFTSSMTKEDFLNLFGHIVNNEGFLEKPINIEDCEKVLLPFFSKKAVL